MTIGNGMNDYVSTTASFSTAGSHLLPKDANGSVSWDAATADRVAVWIENNQDASMTATLERTHRRDPSFSKAWADASVVVGSGGSTQALAGDPDFPMGHFRLAVSFSQAPSGNNATFAYWESATTSGGR